MKSGIEPRKEEEDEDQTGGGGGGRMRERRRGGGWRRRTWRDMYMKYVLFSDSGLNHLRPEIGPLRMSGNSPLCSTGPLPCSHSTSFLDHSKQGIGYR